VNTTKWVLISLLVLAILGTSHAVAEYYRADTEALKVCVENGGEWTDTSPDSGGSDMGCLRPDKND